MDRSLRPANVDRLLLLLLVLVLALASPAAYAAGPEGGLDSRGWEMASPVDKNGGEVSAPGGKGAGVLRAASGGSAIAFASAASFGPAQGAAPQSQYVASRGASAWSTQNVTPPLLSGTYSGGAYQLFAPDLAREILSGGWSCRDGGETCPAENPPLAAGAPAGYRNLYLREGGSYEPLITTANLPASSTSAQAFELSLQGASPDLRHVVLIADGGLYEWSQSGGDLALIDAGPGATLAAPSGAISADGSRVYWAKGGNLYLHEAGTSVQVDESLGGGGEFQTASTDGSVAYFVKAGHLYRYEAGSEATQDISPGGEVQGALGASDDGSYVYYLAVSGPAVWHAGVTTPVAPSADPSNLPAATGTARVTPDGTRLAFLSSASLTGYPNAGKVELYLYEAPAKRLLCASCNPKGTVPQGDASIPGAFAAGDGPAANRPRALTSEGTRLFFDSADALVSTDTNHSPDVYEWQAKGTGGCTKTAGCIGLISSGRSESATLLDASVDGTDVFFLTEASLLPADTGSADVYDARAGGGYPEPPAPIPCLGDACQGPAPAPEDFAPATGLILGSGNPAPKKPHREHHKKHHKHGQHGKGGKRAHGAGGRR